MRILHLDSGRQMRGGQWQVLRLHRRLLAQGHDSLLLARRDGPLLATARREALPCAELGLALPRGFEIVHAHDARSHSLAACLARSPLVVSRRVAFPVRSGPLSRWKYSRPARFLAVSNFVALELRRAGVPKDRIAVVYDGVPVPAQPAHGGEVLIPFTLDPAKGMALAEAAAARAGIAVRRSPDLEAELPRARALIYLTRSEGLGSGILLAMAHGVTVVASNTGGIPELIEDGVNGILTRNDEASVAAAIGRIDPQFGAAARATVMQKFTEERMVCATLEAYRSCL